MNTSNSHPEITIVGVGISGLYVAYCLTELYGVPGSNIAMVGEYLPGDQSANGYTSPWAGGNWSCITPADPETMFFDKFSYQNLKGLSEKLLAHFSDKDGESLGLARRPSHELWDYMPPAEKIKSLGSYLEEFEVLTKEQLSAFGPSPPHFGIGFKTWNFNCPVFLVNFAQFLTEKHGVVISRQKLTHIAQAEAFVNPSAKGNDKHVIFNCTGLGSKTLSGVSDDKVYATRGQVVVITAPHVAENCLRWGKDYATYIIPRPGPLNELVLGGFLQVDDWNAQDTFKEQTEDILKRTTTLLSKIGDVKPSSILRVAAGLRPSRYGGPRVEREKQGKDGNLIVVHNYGASGYGYQSGLGLAYKAATLALYPDRTLKL